MELALLARAGTQVAFMSSLAAREHWTVLRSHVKVATLDITTVDAAAATLETRSRHVPAIQHWGLITATARAQILELFRTARGQDLCPLVQLGPAQAALLTLALMHADLACLACPSAILPLARAARLQTPQG